MFITTEGMSFVAVLPIFKQRRRAVTFTFALRISSRRRQKGGAESLNGTASRGSRSARQAVSEVKLFLTQIYAHGRGRGALGRLPHGPPQDNLLGKSLEFRDRVAPCVGALDLRGISAWDQDGGCTLLNCAEWARRPGLLACSPAVPLVAWL